MRRAHVQFGTAKPSDRRKLFAWTFLAKMRKTQLVVSQRVRLHDGGRGIELGERPVPAEVRRLDSTVHFGRAVACLVRLSAYGSLATMLQNWPRIWVLCVLPDISRYSRGQEVISYFVHEDRKPGGVFNSKNLSDFKYSHIEAHILKNSCFFVFQTLTSN